MQETNLAIEFKKIPWLKTGYETLIERFKGTHPPHALLLAGKDGIGKSELVDALVAGILCLSPEDQEPCGRCQSCRWLATHFHPDFYEIKGDTEIKVDEIRKIHQFSQLTPETGCKVVVIKQADKMNINAANSLLKVLEEPPGDLFFILESSRGEKLPITVRSRCQTYFVSSPDETNALRYLQSLVADRYSLSVDDLRMLLALSFDAPFVALQYLEGDYIEKRKILVETIQALFEGQLIPSKGVGILLESEALSFDLLFFLLNASFKPEKQAVLPGLSMLFTVLSHFPEKFRLMQYEKLVEIDRLRTSQTRTDWALEAWFVEFLG